MSEPKELVAKELDGKRRYFVEDSGEDFDDWMGEEVGSYGNKLVEIDRTTLKAIARRSTYVKVLRFLLRNNSRDFSRKEIKNSLKMPESTVARALVRLVKADVLEKNVPSVIDKRYKCYRITNLSVVVSIVELHDRMISFQLARVLPYTFVSLDSLEEDYEFLALCKKFRLDFSDAIECLKMNSRKVEPVLSKDKLVGFKRKEQ